VVNVSPGKKDYTQLNPERVLLLALWEETTPRQLRFRRWYFHAQWSNFLRLGKRMITRLHKIILAGLITAA